MVRDWCCLVVLLIGASFQTLLKFGRHLDSTATEMSKCQMSKRYVYYNTYTVILIFDWFPNTYNEQNSKLKSRTKLGAIQYRIRHLMVRSHTVSMVRDKWLEFSNSSDIWHASRQHCCRGACQMSKRYEHFNTRARAIEAMRSYQELSCAVQNRSPGPYFIILIFDWFPNIYNEQNSQPKSITKLGAIQYRIRHLIVRSHTVSMVRDKWLEFSNYSDIWHASRQHCCRGACQMSKRYEHFNTRARAIETMRSYQELSCAVQNRSPGPYTIILIFDWFPNTYNEQNSQLTSIT